MGEPSDWRRTGQEKYLTGATLVRRAYLRSPSNPSWDHDHCEFCFQKFVEGSEGYATADAYRWVCDGCFADFRDEFAWIVDPRA